MYIWQTHMLSNEWLPLFCPFLMAFVTSEHYWIKGNNPSSWLCSVSVCDQMHMVPKLPSGAVAQWPNLQLRLNKHQRHCKFRQLDSLCTAAEETSSSVSLRPELLYARPSLSCSTDISQGWHSSAGLVYTLVWCESVQSSWLCPQTWKIGPLWYRACERFRSPSVSHVKSLCAWKAAQVLVSSWWVILQGPEGCWKLFKVSLLSYGEMSWRDLDSTDERNRVWWDWYTAWVWVEEIWTTRSNSHQCKHVGCVRVNRLLVSSLLLVWACMWAARPMCRKKRNAEAKTEINCH